MTNPLYALTDHDHTENERNKTMRKHSKTMSMGLMPTPYLVQLETFISPGLPYLSLIGFPDEDHRRIRNRIRSACEAVGCGLPACRTTVNLMPASMPKLPGLCVLACAVSILAADGRIPSAERLEDTIILGDVNEDGTIPPIDADLTDLAASPRAGWKSTASSSHRRTSPERPSPPASMSSDWAASTSC